MGQIAGDRRIRGGQRLALIERLGADLADVVRESEGLALGRELAGLLGERDQQAQAAPGQQRVRQRGDVRVDFRRFLQRGGVHVGDLDRAHPAHGRPHYLQSP